MSLNHAAWILEEGANPFVVRETPTPKAGLGQLVIKNSAVAINPVDWKVQDSGRYFSTYPFILGEDASGIVHEVGEGVTRFTKGQRIIAHCHGLRTANPENSSFQLYTQVSERFVSPLPDFLTFEQGAVLPLAVSTAASGLYLPNYLGLPLPKLGTPVATNKTILIWGGASSVGAATIQLAVASGLEVITTASPANHEFVKSLGASAVFDYRSKDVVADIAAMLKGKDLAGVYEAIAEETTFEAVRQILETLDKVVKIASSLPYEKPTEKFAPNFIQPYGIIEPPNQHIGECIWADILPRGMADGSFKVVPEPQVVGHGLNNIQHALAVQKKGVSAKKIVVTL